MGSVRSRQDAVDSTSAMPSTRQDDYFDSRSGCAPSMRALLHHSRGERSGVPSARVERAHPSTSWSGQVMCHHTPPSADVSHRPSDWSREPFGAVARRSAPGPGSERMLRPPSGSSRSMFATTNSPAWGRSMASHSGDRATVVIVVGGTGVGLGESGGREDSEDGGSWHPTADSWIRTRTCGAYPLSDRLMGRRCSGPVWVPSPASRASIQVTRVISPGSGSTIHKTSAISIAAG